MKLRLSIWFLLAQILTGWFVFRGGLWGESLLAPLDVAPAFFPQYRYLDPSSSGVPANHWIIDQLTYDLPEQWTIYKAFRRGEVPWWDPYNLCGRPLLTDAAIGGTDPIRLIAYVLFPFEVAYNWTRVIHFFLSGLSMLLLLRYFGFRDWQCLLLALAFEFSGNFIMHFGHPFLQASFLYYPLLWLVWDLAFSQRHRWSYALAPLLVAAVFYSGSLQSHAYIVFFALAFAIGYGGRKWSEWKRLLPLLAGSGLAGGCLASPVIFNQIELYFIGTHGIGTGYNRFSFLEGLVSFSAVYPWALGTFRTLDASKLFAQPQPLGFIIFIGSAAFLLAMFGAISKNQCSPPSPARRTAICLCGLYFLIVSTPLVQLLYVRCATLAIMGLVILAAFGLEEALRRNTPSNFGRFALILTLIIAVSTNLTAWMLYPKVLPKVEQFLEAHKSTGLEEVPALRRSQAANLPAEVSFQNPETVLASLGMLSVATLLLWPPRRSREFLWAGVLVLNLVPSLLFCYRFVPRHPMTQWDRLLAGGPEQQKLAALLRDTPLRLLEPGDLQFGKVFPLAMSHLYEVRTVHGYSSLRPYGLSLLSTAEQTRLKPQLADWIYESGKSAFTGGLVSNSFPGVARFQWLNSPTRPFRVEQIGLNALRLSFAPGPEGALLWTDTFYPGWQALMDGSPVKLKQVQPFFREIEVPASAKVLILKYQPRFLVVAKICALFALISIALLAATCIISKANGGRWRTKDVAVTFR